MMLTAGTYYVGDLCYVMTDDEWMQVCNSTIKDDRSSVESGVFSLQDGRKYSIHSTRWGDGSYTDQRQNRYSVDSGSIGCIRLEDISVEFENEEHLKQVGAIHTFEHDFSTSGGELDDPDWYGDIRIGHVVIRTGDDDDSF